MKKQRGTQHGRKRAGEPRHVGEMLKAFAAENGLEYREEPEGASTSKNQRHTLEGTRGSNYLRLLIGPGEKDESDIFTIQLVASETARVDNEALRATLRTNGVDGLGKVLRIILEAAGHRKLWKP